jgi:hypothetical protein
MNQQSIRARSSLLGPDQPGPVDVGGRGNSWWEMRLRDARGRRMTIRLNGFPSADRQQFMRTLQPYLDRPQMQVEGRSRRLRRAGSGGRGGGAERLSVGSSLFVVTARGVERCAWCVVRRARWSRLSESTPMRSFPQTKGEPLERAPQVSDDLHF